MLDDDSVFLKWLEQMATYGIALIENAPSSRFEIRKLAKRVGFIKTTHYGDEFTVTSKDKTTAHAYSQNKLQLHVDVPYYDQMPGINMLHCLSQSKSSGGGNTLVDGFYIANEVKRKYPEYFEILTKIHVNWCDIGIEEKERHHCLLRAPVIW